MFKKRAVYQEDHKLDSDSENIGPKSFLRQMILQIYIAMISSWEEECSVKWVGSVMRHAVQAKHVL